MTKMQITKIVLGALFILAIGFSPSIAKAATLYLDPALGKIGPDDTVEVKVKMGVDSNECINAVQVGINFPSDILEVKDFNSGESILSLWVEKPDHDSLLQINKDGKIIFSGGTPGGYCGKIPGDPGDSNILGSIIFNVKKPIIFHKAKLDFTSDTQAFLNDGQGTLAVINVQGSVLDIDEKIKEKKDTWAETLAADNIPPEPFTIEISQDQNIASGKYFLVFSAVDKQTGIDHYEVLESYSDQSDDTDNSANNKINFFSKFLKKIFKSKKSVSSAWVKASSPYILNDQTLKSQIEVKAIDRAGNETMAEYDNAALKSLQSKKIITYKSLAPIIGGLVLLIFVLVPAIIFWRKKRAEKRRLF
jgi:hypothetical protein